jgi:hypothetical protein
MKKLLMVMAVAGFFACNNAAETTTPSADTTVKPVETPGVTDTLKSSDTTVKAPADTLKK